MIKAVIFDFDDTLIQTYENCLGMISSISHRLGLKTPDKETINKNWGKSAREVISRLWPGSNFDDVNRMRLESPMNCPPVNGTHEIIDILNKNYVIGVLTGEERPAFIRKAIQAGVDLKKFSFIITGSENPLPKSDPKYFDLAFREIEKLGASRKEILFVGDSIHDFELSQHAGIHFVGVLTGPTRKEDLISQGMEERMIIPSIIELPQFIRNNGFG